MNCGFFIWGNTISKEEKKNAKQFPTVYYARHMYPGIAGYEDETILVDDEAIKKMVKSFVGKPVYIQHKDVELETLKEDAAGYIADSFFNETDGWAWVKFIAIDDECHQAISEGWSVSNAYIPDEFAPGGTKHNCPYDRKILGGDFTHLAIVPDPRYEDAKIYSPDEFKIYQESKKRELEELRNSKGKNMFKLFKNEKTEVTSVDEDTMIELQNGKSISVKEMINAVEEDEKENEKDDEQLVNVGGEEMPLKELINRYMKMNEKDEEKENSEEEEKENTSDEDEKENESDEDEKENEDDEEKKNSRKHFDELRNANKSKASPVIETTFDKLQRGKQLF